MKKRVLSLLVCLCMLASIWSVTALAAGEDVAPAMTEGPVLYLDGEKLVPTAEGTTHTFENGGVATLTTLGRNEAGGTDYALTLENVQAAKSTRMAMLEDIYAANLFFVSSQPITLDGAERKDTLAITLKGENMIFVLGQADEAVATALVSQCPTSISGEGSLTVWTAPAEGAQTTCVGASVTGGLTVGASLKVMGTGTALTLNGELALTDGATLRWPTEQVLSAQADAPMGLAGQVLMNGEAVADTVAVAVPSDPVTRGVAVFNLWRMKGSPAPEGEYPFTDEPMVGFLRDAIQWSAEAGIAKGYGDGTFGADDPITNEQFAVMFYRMIGSPAVEGDFPADYPYAGSVSPWAHDAVLRFRANAGASPKDPQGILTHGQMDQLVEILKKRLG